MTLTRAALSLAALAVLAACSTTTNLLEAKRVDYKSAGQLPTLEIPPDLTTPARDNRYVVPETGKSSATLSDYQADRAQQAKTGAVQTGVLPSIENIRVERAGTQRWLVVAQPPEKLWPVVRDFWQENGFLIAVNVPEAGVMETDWAENRAKIPQDWIRNMLGQLIDSIYSTAERDKFRTRLERTDEGTTEIYISHRGMIEVFQDVQKQQSMWQPRPPDPELEAEFLRRLMVRLGTQEEKAKQQVASSTPAAARAAIQTGIGGVETLEVFEPFDRTWRRLGLALDRVGFTVEDRDRQKGQYFVRYADTDASDMAKKDSEKGFLSKLAFWKPSEPAVPAEQYRVHIRQFAGKCVVQILNKDGAQANTQTTRKIIALLYEQLR
ncbi:MAG TPA: outer membrane protein assembly factor BamC [Burkholderiales bacterium]|nr:outer membrane protein assembly factor BamC [Burkholderiales bacterium]